MYVVLSPVTGEECLKIADFGLSVPIQLGQSGGNSTDSGQFNVVLSHLNQA